MTLKECIAETCKTLNHISVPIELYQAVAAPILAAVQNLNACLDAMNREPQKEEMPNEEDHDQ